MNRSTCGLRSCSAALAGFMLVAGAARGQISDRLYEGITDHMMAPVAPARTLSYTFPEGAEGPMFRAFPALTVDFYEPTTPPNLPRISDRFHFEPYTVRVESDDTAALPRRAGAILIPFSALETFTAMYIAGGSDGDVIPGGPDSDRLTIVFGSYAGFAGTTFLDMILPEAGKGSESATFTFSAFFDVEEPDEGQPGWHPGLISDYVDILDLTGFFLSSDSPGQYDPNMLVNGTITEKLSSPGDPNSEWGRLDYRLNFESDVVPGPGTLLVLGMGLVPGLLPARRRAR